MNFTEDKFLGNKVLLLQSEDGLRATSDSVLVAALVPVKEGETVLDIGAGNGIIGCCINARVKCKITAYIMTVHWSFCKDFFNIVI